VTEALIVAIFTKKQTYGGPEEGGWWYDEGELVPEAQKYALLFTDEDEAFRYARSLNGGLVREHNEEQPYPYHSVLSRRAEHWTAKLLDIDEFTRTYSDWGPWS